MELLRQGYAILRRGLGHAGELWLLTQTFQSLEPFRTFNRLIETNLLFFALIVTAFNCLIELWNSLANPDLQALSAACNDDSPMLPFSKDKE